MVANGFHSFILLHCCQMEENAKNSPLKSRLFRVKSRPNATSGLSTSFWPFFFWRWCERWPVFFYMFHNSYSVNHTVRAGSFEKCLNMSIEFTRHHRSRPHSLTLFSIPCRTRIDALILIQKTCDFDSVESIFIAENECIVTLTPTIAFLHWLQVSEYFFT